MIQLLKTEDALKCFLFDFPKSKNMVTVRNVQGNDHSIVALRANLVREALFPRYDQRLTVVCRDKFHLNALGTVGVRSGIKVWEIERLYLSKEDWDGIEELLNNLGQHVGQLGGQRIFLRAPQASPLVECAERAGFSIFQKEHLLQGTVGTNVLGHPRSENLNTLRPIQHHEELALFQLYCDSTPLQIRSTLGVTLDQWRDARDKLFKDGQDMVCDRESKIGGWINLHGRRRSSQVGVMVLPDDEQALASLMSYALSQYQDQAWLLADYQDTVRRLLIHNGFYEMGCYYQMVKWIAVKADRFATVPMEVCL